MFALLTAVLIVLLASALCSGTEAALFSLPIVKAKQLAESKGTTGKALLWIRENMSRPIAAIVVLNNIANIVGSMVIGELAKQALGAPWLGIFPAFFTFMVILLSEIIPKTLGEQHAERVSLLVARPVRLLTKLLTPLLWVIETLTSPLNQGSSTLSTNEAEIQLLAQIGKSEGVIEEDEAEMLKRVFLLNDLYAEDLMTPRVVMTYLKGADTLETCKQQILDSQHSRILVIQETPDEVTGVVLKQELLIAMLEGKENEPVSHFQKHVHTVPHHEQADQLLPLFQKSRRHIAVVQGEFGGVLGVITLEDVLEVLTGDIVDETDKDTSLREVARQRRQRRSKTSTSQKGNKAR